MTNSFALDRDNAKVFGVCAGLARATEIDPLLVRLATFLSLFVLGPIVPALYLLTAWIADKR